MLEFESKVTIRNRFPDNLDPTSHILLYDEAIESNEETILGLTPFIEHFPHRLALPAGEALKDFSHFSKNLDRLLKVWPKPISRSHCLLVMGGGSMGDFGGFVASVLKRGVKLVHIPSTWLAAIDSAHGGKNALNLAKVKNQLGTFYPAEKVYVIKDLLEGAPPELKQQSFGELIKMSLIGDSKFFNEILNEKRQAEDFMWRFVRHCIEDKYHVILQDPYEKKKIRQVLNFGHTLGHAFESYFEWSHGESVLQGIFFSLEWSRYRGDLSQGTYNQIMSTLSAKFDRGPATDLNWFRKPSARAIRKLIESDKKIDKDGNLQFVFLKTIGRPMVKTVLVDDLISEAKRQNWLK